MMKKIGVLSGHDNTFTQALIDRINEKEVDGITAEFVSIDKVIQGTPIEYSVVLDRISQQVPFYRTWLKQASLEGVAVINNPFWWSADDKFVHNELAHRTGVKVPKTALLPTRSLPDNTTDKSFHNLVYPFDWDAIFDHIGFPAFLKPYNGGGWKNVYKIHNREEFFAQHARTGQLVMMLQEEITYESYYRVYCIGGKYVRIISYDPYQPENQRYLLENNGDKAYYSAIREQVAALNRYLGYDFNAVEIAVSKGIPYVIDFWNPSPDADPHVIGDVNFEWVVETMAAYAIERAEKQIPNQDNLTWGEFLRQAVQGKQTVVIPGVTAVAAKKPAAKPKAAAKPTKEETEAAPKKPAAKKTKKKE